METAWEIFRRSYPAENSRECPLQERSPRTRSFSYVIWPTGALDYNTGKAILKLLQDTCRKRGMTVVLITHNSAIAPMADRVIKIKNGRVSKIVENPSPVPVETIEW